GLVEEHLKGIPARLYFRVNKKAIVAAIDQLASQFAENRKTSMSEVSEQERDESATKNEQELHTTTETTQETSTKNTDSASHAASLKNQRKTKQLKSVTSNKDDPIYKAVFYA